MDSIETLAEAVKDRQCGAELLGRNGMLACAQVRQ
jgi:hypothetical protein